jgi:hypothetical protein
VIPPEVAREIARQVSAEELRVELARPIGDAEREDVVSLIRWFTGRYRSPAARMSYVRRAYRRWSVSLGLARRRAPFHE